MRIDLNQIRCQYGEREVLHSISGVIPLCMNILIGPNGSGKTTLLKCIAGMLPYSGSIQFNQRESHQIPRAEKETLVSYLPQMISPKTALTVYEVVLLGRMNSLKWRVGSRDHELVFNILKEMGLSDMSDRYISEMSGGQRQKVFLAQALIKSPKILLLDEPTSSLDLQYQLELFNRIDLYIKDQAMSAIITLHDINLACRYAHHITVLKEGHIVASGLPRDTITSSLIANVYQVNAEIFTDSRNNHQIIPYQVINV